MKTAPHAPDAAALLLVGLSNGSGTGCNAPGAEPAAKSRARLGHVLAAASSAARPAPAAAALLCSMLCSVLCALLLSACATDEPASGARAAKRPAAARPAPPVRPTPPPLPEAAPGAQSGPGTAAMPATNPDARQRQQPAPASAAAEWAQLAPYRKAPFQVFSLTDTQGGFKPAPGAVGVYVQAADAKGPIRLRLALRPDSPVRLALGTYTVQLQLALEYTERRACKAASCNGEIEESLRKTSKTLRLLLSPKSGYAAETTLPPALLQSGPPDRDYDVSYTSIVLKVRRLGIAPARR